MKQIIYFLFIFFYIINISQSQTKIVTKSGNKVMGIIVSENTSEIVMKSLNNEELIIPISSIVSRDIMYFGVKTKSGISFEGTIIFLNEDGFELLSKDGLKMSIKFDAIDRLFFDDKELKKVLESKLRINEIQYTNSVANNDDEIVKSYKSNIYDSYHKIGFALGTPGIGNFVYGHTSNKLGFHLSGGYWGGKNYGIQIGPTINLSLKENSEHNLVIAFSYLKIDYKSFESMNLLWEANFSGFHIQAGLGFGDGYFSSPQLMFQIGYAYRWGSK